ncbi:MAG: CoA pyrophosphatase [Gammaproteobacteria bacterium]|nr:CoA pyrophosphatase [Gammaproteobacteria bacterium]
MLANVIGRPSNELLARLDSPNRDAAVLVAFVPRRDELHLIFTQRANHLPHHPGQISFPGGQLEADEDPVSAALREAHEEVGLEPAQVAVLGSMGPHVTVTSFLVTPVVGWVSGDFVARPDPGEVEAVFEVPLTHLLDAGNRRRATRERWDTRFVSDEFHFEGHRIWGATASILSRFIEIVNE